MMSGRSRRLLICLAAIAPLTAKADYAIWLDFSSFDLDEFAAHGATCTNEALVEELVIAEVVRDYAAYEVQVTVFQPSNHHVRVAIGGTGAWASLIGTSAPPGGPYSFNNWAAQYASRVEVYPDYFASQAEFQSSNGTCSRIANAIAGTVSHEVGHNVWLRHENANTSCPGPDDLNVDDPWNYIMASGTLVSDEQRATLDRTFTPRCSNVILSEELKPRGYHTVMGNAKGNLTWSDLVKLEVNDLFDIDVSIHQSNGSTLASTPVLVENTLRADAIYLLGDTTLDGKVDLMEGVALPACSGTCTEMLWVEYENVSGTSMTVANIFRMGEPGDRFRLADVNGDGYADLVRGRARTTSLPGSMAWSVKYRTSSGWQSELVLKDPSAGPLRPTWVVDANGDGKADLVRANADLDWTRRFQPACDPTFEPDCTDPSIEEVSSTITFKMSEANAFGTGFLPTITMRAGPFAGNRTGISLFGDLSGDGYTDLIQGRGWSSVGTSVGWYVYTGGGSGTLGFPAGANLSLGDDGEFFRLGNYNGDSRVDLLWGDPNDSWRWRRATGAATKVLSTEGNLRSTTDADGVIYP